MLWQEEEQQEATAAAEEEEQEEQKWSRRSRRSRRSSRGAHSAAGAWRIVFVTDSTDFGGASSQLGTCSAPAQNAAAAAQASIMLTSPLGPR